jgi:transcriptional regulator with XRE-family HTH domain
MVAKKTAPAFASRLRDLIRKQEKSQRQIANECNISSSAVNRLCKDGVGSDKHICIILDRLNLKRRRILEMLADRRAELSEGIAQSVWRDFKYAYLDEDEYLTDVCTFPLDRAFACTYLGIRIREVIELAKSYGISNVEDLRKIDPWKFAEFVRAFEKKYGKDKRKAVLARECKPYAPVLLLDFKKKVNAVDCLKLRKCKGNLLFGLSHLVIGDYEFFEGGQIEAGEGTGGVELVYSLEGDFELKYQETVYPTKLRPNGSIFVFDGRKKHTIRLAEGNRGRLIVAMYYPKEREVLPDRLRRSRSK